MHQRTPKDIQGDMSWYLDIMLEMADRTVEQICTRQNIKPEKAYPAAVSLVLKSVDLMNEEAEREQRPDTEGQPDETEELLGRPVDDLELGTRVRNAVAGDFYTIGELVKLTERQVLDIPNLGTGSLLEIKEALAQRGLSLSTSPSVELKGLSSKPYEPSLESIRKQLLTYMERQGISLHEIVTDPPATPDRNRTLSG